MGNTNIEEMIEDWKPEDEDITLSKEDERLVQEIIECLKRQDGKRMDIKDIEKATEKYTSILSIKDWVKVDEDDVNTVLATVESNRILTAALISVLMHKKIITKRELIRSIAAVSKAEKELEG